VEDRDVTPSGCGIIERTDVAHEIVVDRQREQIRLVPHLA
jgi:hypothetical protein